MRSQFSFRSPRIKWFLFSTAGVILISWIGDYLLYKWDKLCDFFTHVLIARIVSKVITDSVIHATIAGWSWLNVWLLQAEEEWSQSKLWQALLCGLLASFLDVDHFIEAGSLRFEDALNLFNRPFLHNTTLILTLTAALFILVLLLSRYKPAAFLHDLPAMFFVACVSHHLRDACRRGLWLVPFGSLPAYRVVYVLGIAALPVIVVACQQVPLCAPHHKLVTARTLSNGSERLSQA